MKSKKRILLLFLLAASTISPAQTPVRDLGNEDVTILKEYQPVLNDAFKINRNPSADSIPFQPLNLIYSPEPVAPPTKFSPSPIKAVRVKDDGIRKLYRGWLKAGYGMENMPLLEASFNALRSKKFDAGISFRHLSSTGKINDYGYPGNSRNAFSAFGTRYGVKHNFGAMIEYESRVNHYYGYNSPPELFEKSETRHSMNTLVAGFNFSNLPKKAWTYQTQFRFYSFGDKKGELWDPTSKANELNFQISGDINTTLEDGQFSTEVLFADNSTSLGNWEFDSYLFTFMPTYAFQKERYRIRFGATVSYDNENSSDDLHLHPYLKAEADLIEGEMQVFAELKGGIQQNTLRSLSQINPYLEEVNSLQTGFLMNSNTKINLMAGMLVKLDPELEWLIRGTYSRVKDKVFFANIDSPVRPLSYLPVYDDASVFQLYTALDYTYNSKLSGQFYIDYTKVNTDELAEALFVPELQLGLQIQYSIANKIDLRTDLFLRGKSFALANGASGEVYEKVDGYFDANLGLDYRYSKVLSLFVTLNNLGMVREFDWYNYPSYRFTAMAGLTWSF